MAQRQRSSDSKLAAPLVDSSLLSTPSDKEMYLRRLCEERAAQRRTQRSAEKVRAPMVDSSLLSTPSEREMYLRRLCEERMAQRRIQRGDAKRSAPFVDCSLLSTPSEREMYLRGLREQRVAAQHERRRSLGEAARRPSLPSHAIEDSAALLDDSHEWLTCDNSAADGCDAHGDWFSSDEHVQWTSDTAALNLDEDDTESRPSTSDEALAAAERADADALEVEALEELEMLEALRLQVGYSLPYVAGRRPAPLSACTCNICMRASRMVQHLGMRLPRLQPCLEPPSLYGTVAAVPRAPLLISRLQPCLEHAAAPLPRHPARARS